MGRDKHEPWGGFFSHHREEKRESSEHWWALMRFPLMTAHYVEGNDHLNSCLPPTAVCFLFLARRSTLRHHWSPHFRFDTSATAGWSCPVGVAPTSSCTTRAYQFYVTEDDVGTNCCIMADVRAEAEAVWKHAVIIMFVMKSGWIFPNATPAF